MNWPLSIVILTYNRPELVPDAVAAAQEQQVDDVVVLSNGGNDPHLSKRLNVRVYERGTNQDQLIGGLNAAFQAAQYPWVLFQSDDVRLDPDCVSQLFKAVWKYDTQAVYQPVLYDPQGRVNHAGMAYVWPGLGLGYRRPVHPTAPYPVPCFTSGCFLMHRDTFNLVGLWDTQFAPAYYEDVDYSLRCHQAGIPTYVVPKAQATHLSTATFTSLYAQAKLSQFCQQHARRVVRKHYRGVDRALRLGGLLAVQALAGVAQQTRRIVR